MNFKDRHIIKASIVFVIFGVIAGCISTIPHVAVDTILNIKGGRMAFYRHLTAGQINRLVGEIVAIASPLRVYLFGSAATGDKRWKSDVDLLVVVTDGAPARQISHMLYNGVTRNGLAIDFIVVNEADFNENRSDPNSVVYSAVHEGREIYAS